MANMVIKFQCLELLKTFHEEKVIKESNVLLTREPTDSLLSDNVDNSDENKIC